MRPMNDYRKCLLMYLSVIERLKNLGYTHRNFDTLFVNVLHGNILNLRIGKIE